MIVIDTNVLSVWIRDGHPDQKLVDKFFQQLGDETIAACEVTRGEVEYGLEAGTRDPERCTIIRNALDRIPLWCPINAEVARVYGVLRGRLFRRYAPKNKRGNSKVKRIELLPVPAVTGNDLQLEENDLWIVSCAVALDVPVFSREVGLKRILDEAREPFDYFHDLMMP